MFRKYVPVVVSLVGTLLAAGCDDDSITEPTENGFASVRFIHAAAAVGNIIFAYLETGPNAYYAATGAADYGQQYGYYEFYSGERKFRVYEDNTNLALSEVSASLTDDEKYTVVQTDLGATANPELLIFADTSERAPDGRAFVRFLHASNDAPALVIRDETLDTLAGVVRYEMSPYREVDTATYTLEACSSEDGAALLDHFVMTLLSGNAYTVIISGSIGTTGTSPIRAQSYLETSL